jgi:hypothetical protein
MDHEEQHCEQYRLYMMGVHGILLSAVFRYTLIRTPSLAASADEDRFMALRWGRLWGHVLKIGIIPLLTESLILATVAHAHLRRSGFPLDSPTSAPMDSFRALHIRTTRLGSPTRLSFVLDVAMRIA